jgi:Xaa-Pro aminopeptidase
VGIDTDMIGPEGYACDISRTFLCGETAAPVQKEAYQLAHDYIQQAIELLKPGVSYTDFLNALPLVPEPYRAQQYMTVVHGIGTDDEPPFLPFPGVTDLPIPDGIFRENMVVSVEFYAGKVGEQDGVKLEDEVWITADGPVVISMYPFDARLLN